MVHMPGRIFYRVGDYERARQYSEQVLKQRHKNGFALYGIAQACALAGDVPKTTQAYRDFLASWQNADATLKQVKNARSWVATHGSNLVGQWLS